MHIGCDFNILKKYCSKTTYAWGVHGDLWYKTIVECADNNLRFLLNF